MGNHEIEMLKKELLKKDEEIEFLKKQLSNKQKQFDTTEVELILNDLKPSIMNQREELIKNNKYTKVENNSLFNLYMDSKLMTIAQKIKKIPLLGRTLLFIKKKILNWDY